MRIIVSSGNNPAWGNADGPRGYIRFNIEPQHLRTLNRYWLLTVVGGWIEYAGVKKYENDIVVNKRAYFDYHIEETLEAGIALEGSEVKALRESKVQVKDCYVNFTGEEAILTNLHISPYQGNPMFGSYDPTRSRKLLLHKKEIARWMGKVQQKGLSALPLRLYWKRGRVKVLIGLGKGKKQHDKRDTIRDREQNREMQRAFKDSWK